MAEAAAQKVDDAEKEAATFKTMADREDAAVNQIAVKIKALRTSIEKTKTDLEMLKSRSKTAEASEQINKALSSVNVDGTQAMIERMSAKVSAQEFRAEAYSSIDAETTSVETDIEKALAATSGPSALEKMKAKRAAKTA